MYAIRSYYAIIPDEVRFTLDARHQDPEVIKQVVEIIKAIPKTVEKCDASYSIAWTRDTVSFSPELVDFVEKNAVEYGYTAKRMYSGPGHDAQFIADIVPTTMIFVPSVGGHSHCEIEFTPVEQCIKA